MDKEVAEDDRVLELRRNLHSHEAVQALSLSEGGDLENVLLGSQGVVLAVNSHSDCGEGVTVGAVLVDGTNLGVDLVDQVLVTYKEGGSAVNDSFAAADSESGTVDLDIIEADFPVSFADELVVSEVRLGEGGVNSAEDQLAAGSAVLGEVEGEAVVVNETLLIHLLEDGGYTISSDAGEGESQDSVELGSDEGGTAEGSHLAEGDFGDLDSTEVDAVLAEESLDAARSVLDLDGGAVLVVGG